VSVVLAAASQSEEQETIDRAATVLTPALSVVSW
jgi:hypothetical protein